MKGRSSYLSTHLANNAQNKSKGSTGAHRYSSKLWHLDAEMLSVVSGKELGRPLSLLGVRSASITAPTKQTLNGFFTFCLFFVKAKILFGLFFG